MEDRKFACITVFALFRYCLFITEVLFKSGEKILLQAHYFFRCT